MAHQRCGKILLITFCQQHELNNSHDNSDIHDKKPPVNIKLLILETIGIQHLPLYILIKVYLSKTYDNNTMVSMAHITA